MIDLLIKVLNFDYWSRKFMGRKNALILLYHSPDQKTFRQHVEYLSNYYSFISLQQLVDSIYKKDWTIIPKNALIFTFDDGHSSNYKLVDIFREYKIIPTIYLVSGVVCTNKKFWWQENIGLINKESLKYISNKERLKIIEENILRTDKPNEITMALSSREIKEMSKSVDFQSHSKNHPIVTMLDDDELTEELKSPIRTLNSYNLNIKHFAYPNGDYSSREIKYLRNCGYMSARTTDIGWNNTNSDPFCLKVMGVSDDASIPKLRLQVSGLFGWILHIVYSRNVFGMKKVISRKKQA